MKKLEIQCELQYEAMGDTDYIFCVEVADHPWQRRISESLVLEPAYSVRAGQDIAQLNRLTQVHGEAGPFRLQYDAVVQVDYELPKGDEVELRISELPADVVPYIWPSRYCESDAMYAVARRTFGQMTPGYSRVAAISQWINDNIEYEVGTTTVVTTARHVLSGRAGVCRDFAHLAIAFCRALSIPARMVTGYTWYEKAPADFHAIFEAYLGGRWILFDPTQLAPVTDLARIATGRDAADTSFATLFGSVRMMSMSPKVKVLDNDAPA